MKPEDRKRLKQHIEGQNIFRRVSVGKLFLVIDQLRAEVERLTAERDATSEDNRMLSERVQRLVDANKSLTAELAKANNNLELIVKREVDKVVAEMAALRERTRWIPVSERLPEDCTDVIVCEIMACYQCVSVGFYDEAGRQWFSKSETADYVTHWMPLPEPPEEG